MIKKRVIIALLSFLTIFGLGQTIFAGSIDYLSNQSADYIRMFSRNGAVEGADIAVYNPAGTAFLKKGFYFQIGNQSIIKRYENDFGGSSTFGSTYDNNYKTVKPTPVLPSLFIINNMGDIAVYFAASACGGGGRVEYPEGVPTFAKVWGSVYSKAYAKTGSAALSAGAANTALGGQYVSGSGKLTALSEFPEATIGGSYRINEFVSVSLAARGVWGIKQYQGKALFGSTLKELDADENAFGIGGIAGVMVRPAKDLALTARYESQTILDWKTKINDGKNFATNDGTPLLFRDGQTRRKDLPAMMALGASYTFFDRLTAIASFDGFFIGLADQHTDDANDSIYSDGYNDSYAKFGWEASLGLEYAVIPNFLKVSAGYMKNDLGGNSNTYNDFDFSLDSNTYCCGGKITPVSNIDFTFGFSDTCYVGAKAVDTAGTTKYRKNAKTIAFSTELRI